jgi:hypothetical protein
MAGALVSASTGAMGSLLEKLGAMLTDEYKLLKNVRVSLYCPEKLCLKFGYQLVL